MRFKLNVLEKSVWYSCEQSKSFLELKQEIINILQLDVFSKWELSMDGYTLLDFMKVESVLKEDDIVRFIFDIFF